MKAIVLREPGGPEQLRLDDVPIPTPESNQILIRLKTAALNRRDVDWSKTSSVPCQGKNGGAVCKSISQRHLQTHT